MRDALAYRLLLCPLNLLLEILNINTFFVFRNGAELVVKTGILNHTKGKMVCRCHEEYFACIRRVSEDIQQDGEVLRGSSRDCNSIVGDRVLRLEEGRQPRRKVLAKPSIAVIRTILQSRKSYGVVGEHFVGGSIKQLRWQESMVRPSVLSSLAANVAEIVGRVILEEGLLARRREDALTSVVWSEADVPSQKID